jgi:hypothetical protein
MTTTFAIDVIQALRPAEVEDFRAFTRNSYLTRGFDAETAGLFFEILYEAIQQGCLEETEKEAIFNRMFPDKPFVESKIDKLMSELKRLLERFLVVQRYVSDENEGNQLLDLAAELRVRRLGVRAQQIIDKAVKFSDTNLLESMERFRFRSQLALEEYDWHCQYNKIKDDLQIPQTIAHVSVYHYAQRISLLNHLLLLQKSAMLPASLEADTGEFEIEPAIVAKSVFLSISLEINHLLKNEKCNVEDFQRLMDEINSKEKTLSQTTLAEFYSYLRNICTILIDAGYTNLYVALHEINKDNLSRGYFYENGMISPNALLSIIQAAVFANQFAWANNFVEHHRGRITGENETSDFYRMNKAICLFGEKRYEEALDIIPFSSTYTSYLLMARRLELKIYYEMRSDLLEHKVEAFRMFISRAGKKVFSSRVYDLCINFVNFVRQLSQSEGPQAKQRSALLEKRIREKKVVGERLWLLEKARELGERK